MKKTVKNSGSWLFHNDSYSCNDIDRFAKDLVKLYPRKEQSSKKARTERIEMMHRFWKTFNT